MRGTTCSSSRFSPDSSAVIECPASASWSDCFARRRRGAGHTTAPRTQRLARLPRERLDPERLRGRATRGAYTARLYCWEQGPCSRRGEKGASPLNGYPSLGLVPPVCSPVGTHLSVRKMSRWLSDPSCSRSSSSCPNLQRVVPSSWPSGRTMREKQFRRR
jgi:hypothetical protein